MVIKLKNNIKRLFLNFNLMDIVFLALTFFLLFEFAISVKEVCNDQASKIGVSGFYLMKNTVLHKDKNIYKAYNDFVNKEKDILFSDTYNELKKQLKDFNINDTLSRANLRALLQKKYYNMSGFVAINNTEKYIITNEHGVINDLDINQKETSQLNDGNPSFIYYKLNSFDKIDNMIACLGKFAGFKKDNLNLGDKKFDLMMFSTLNGLGPTVQSIINNIRSSLKFIGILSIIALYLLVKLIYFIMKYKKGFFKSLVKEDFILNLSGSIPLKAKFYIQLIIEGSVIIALIVTGIWRNVYNEYMIDNFTGINQTIVEYGFVLILFLHILKSYKLLKVRGKIKKLSEGNYEKIIIQDIESNKEIYEMINNISKGYNNMLLDNIKNEKLKTELITNVSHDLKTPLTSIINYIDILNNQKVSEEDRVKYLKILERKSSRLKSLILNLVEVSKLSSGKVELEKNNIKISDLLYQCLGECETSYSDKSLDFIVNIENKDIEILADGGLLARAFDNIIDNIYKYSLDNTRVYIDIKKTDDVINIDFKNISKEALNFDGNELFERFVRGDISRDSKVKGSGLGLAIAKAIIELHGFNIDIKINGDLFLLQITLKES